MRNYITLFLSFVVCVTSVHAAQAGRRDMAAEARIEQQLAALNPALVAPFREARIAADANDIATAARLLKPVVDQAPQFDPALRRLGSAMVRTGNRAEGLRLIRQALALNRSAANCLTLASALALSGEGKASDSEVREAYRLMQECLNLPGGQDEDALIVATQLAFTIDNQPEAHRLAGLLREKFPDLMQTHFFSAYVAAMDEKWIAAENEILTAEKLGLNDEAVKDFLDRGVHSRALTWRWLQGIAWTVAAWVLGLASLFGLGYLLSRVTLHQIERADPIVPVQQGERRLRQIYRTVLNLTGIYYYISLPIVALLLVLVCGGILYGFLAIGRIPIQITVMLVIGVFATLWGMGKSLFLRAKLTQPGRALARDEAEGLWQLSEEVARDLDTRPIDEIRLTPGTDLCVYEQGTWREKMENRAKRVLVLGAAVINDFKISAFRSVLAHEYGHFSNRDTAGGDVALRVRNDMIKFYYAMVEAGQNTWLNVAFHFLRGYNLIFRRISHGATRLQEVLADRVAARHYGPAAFETGLRHVIRQSAGFDFLADREINEALKGRQPIANLYSLSSPEHPGVVKSYEDAINRPTTEDDTHPGPLDRFRLIARLPEPPRPEESGCVWDLFKDRAAIAAEMMQVIEKNVAQHRR
jgi:tetratricopeptide (TPR) repeat protein